VRCVNHRPQHPTTVAAPMYGVLGITSCDQQMPNPTPFRNLLSRDSHLSWLENYMHAALDFGDNMAGQVGVDDWSCLNGEVS
jgi:hypothetical protein